MTEDSYEIAFALVKKANAFSDGEEIGKPCLQILARSLGDKSIERKADDIKLSKQIATRLTEELSMMCLSN